MNDTARGDVVTLDPENPWLGLFSYTEETRAYFHGRDEEVAELARRVQGRNLSVLFGQSGLGKTSLLRAGLVPRLRDEGFRPVYVRIDYAPTSPTPSEQIKQAIFRATATSGAWTRPGSAVAGESLWAFLHHRGDQLCDAAGQALTPLLIFDQFEEIFTLGQADDAGRERAKHFLADLADLVENRPPAELERRMDDDDAVAEAYDFARADYRVLIALREDYLAHLESVKASMPSITQNRMRLARMTGAQALTAVRKPGGKLVSQEVAESIVRFVAGGSELANAEVEPSLLSLVCRELNGARIAQDRTEISADLLAGSRDGILGEFYERALADQPEGVRRVVEDELLTDSGYRESLAEERVRKALAEAGAAPDALATLVNRRLLRIEERLDVRRVELTHDVLCGVVLASRNLRHEREKRDAAERELAEQRERESTAHRALVRMRMVAMVCIAVMLFAVAAAVFGWISMQHARAAQAEAQKSRTDAENLVGFLIEDFYADLAPTGRLETLGKLARKAVAYYDSLPPQLVTTQTRINRAMALIREGAAMQSSGQQDDAEKMFRDAQDVFGKLRAGGDNSEPVIYGLALALEIQGSSITTPGNDHGTPEQLVEAAKLLHPLVYGKDATRRARQTYADTLNYLSHTQPPAQGVATCEEALKVLAGMGALDLSNLDATASYADTGDSEARFLLALGRMDEARRLEEKVLDLTNRLLVRRPGDQHALADRYFANELLASLARIRHDDTAALDFAQQAVQAGEEQVRFNPSDLSTWLNWARGLGSLADLQRDRGELAPAQATAQKLFALADDKRRPAPLGPLLWTFWISDARAAAESGDTAGAARALQNMQRDLTELLAQYPASDPRQRVLPQTPKFAAGMVQLLEGKPQQALATETAVITALDAMQMPAGVTRAGLSKNQILNGALVVATQASLQTNACAQAETFAQRWVAMPQPLVSEADPRDTAAAKGTLLAQALACQNKVDDAMHALAPALTWYRDALKAGAGNMGFRADFARALYVDALLAGKDGARRKADLDEARKQLAGATPEAHNTVTMRYLQGLVDRAGR